VISSIFKNLFIPETRVYGALAKVFTAGSPSNTTTLRMKHYALLISKIGSHDKIVLYNKGTSLGIEDPSLHDLGSDQTLFRVKVGTGFIDKIDITWFGKSKNNSDSL
jgi:hypothetical protein